MAPSSIRPLQKARQRRRLPSPAHSRNYVLQGGDFISLNYGVERIFDFGFSSFSVDSKLQAYILREGETEVPESLQRAWDFGKRAQGIMREHVRVGMTSGEALEEIVAALEAEGYIYTPFTDDGEKDYRMVQDYLAGTDSPGFYLDLHAQGNNNGELMTVGPSIAPFPPRSGRPGYPPEPHLRVRIRRPHQPAGPARISDLYQLFESASGRTQRRRMDSGPKLRDLHRQLIASM